MASFCKSRAFIHRKYMVEPRKLEYWYIQVSLVYIQVSLVEQGIRVSN